MKEQLVSSETAQLAREKGFDWETPVFRVRLEDTENNYMRPSQSLLQKWLRDVHGWHILLIPVVTMHYTYKIMKVWKKDFDPDLEIETPPYKGVNAYDYGSFEEALEEGLKEVLKLI